MTPSTVMAFEWIGVSISQISIPGAARSGRSKVFSHHHCQKPMNPPFRAWNPSLEFVTTMTEKLLTYALGRSLEHFDAPTVRQIVRNSADGDYRWSSLILGIVGSTPFQMRSAGEP